MSFTGVLGILIGAYLAGILLLRLTRLASTLTTPALPGDYGSIAGVGRFLFSEAMIPFEITSFLLLVSIVGVVVLARGPSLTHRGSIGHNVPLPPRGEG